MVLMVYKSWILGVQPCLRFSCASLLLHSAQQTCNPGTVHYGLVTAGEACPWVCWRKYSSFTLSLETLVIKCALFFLHGWKPYTNWKNNFLLWFWILWIRGSLVTHEKLTMWCRKSPLSTVMTYIRKLLCRKGCRCSNNVCLGVVFSAFVSWVIWGSSEWIFSNKSTARSVWPYTLYHLIEGPHPSTQFPKKRYSFSCWFFSTSRRRGYFT